MSTTKEAVMLFLEGNRNRGFAVKEIVSQTQCSESRVRKHLYDLVGEGIVEQRGENPAYYGFIGFACEYREQCDEVADPVCMAFAHHCPRRDAFIDEAEADAQAEKA